MRDTASRARRELPARDFERFRQLRGLDSRQGAQLQRESWHDIHPSSGDDRRVEMERTNSSNRCRYTSKLVGERAGGNGARAKYRTNRALEFDGPKYHGRAAGHDGGPGRGIAGRTAIWRMLSERVGCVSA